MIASITRSQSLRSAYFVVPVRLASVVVFDRFGDLAFRDAVGEELLDAAEALLQHVLVHLEDDGLEAGRRRHLRDARAHQPATQHTNRLDRHRSLSV